MINLEHHCIPFEPGQTVYVKHGPNTVLRFIIEECVLTISKKSMSLSYKDGYNLYGESEVYGTAEAAFTA